MASKTNSKKSNMSLLMTHLGALIAVTCWGLSFVATKIIMDGGVVASPDNVPLSPTEAYLYRFIFAYGIIAIFSHKKWRCNTLREELFALLCGMTSGSLYFIAENTALEFTYAANVSLLSGTSPLVTILVVGLLYKSERPGKGIILGSLVAFAGVTCVILNSASSLEIKPIGDILALSTAFLWAFYSLLIKKLDAFYDALFITRKTFFYGIITALPFLALEPHIQNPITVIEHGWPWVDGSLVFLILGPSVIAFYLWTVTVKRLGAVDSNNYMYLQSVVTVIASAIILGERITMLGFVGFGLILFGLWFGHYVERRLKAHPR